MILFSIVFRTVFFYILIMVLYRIMGKREIGQLGIIDLIVTILIAEFVAISIENLDQSIFQTIIPIIVLVLLEISIAFISIKSRRIKTAIDGKPSLIVYDGKINYKEMIKQRYSLDDLLLNIRQQNIKTLEDIEYAFLETNGKLSVFKYERYKTKTAYPMPIIVDGNIDENTLKRLKKNKNWLYAEIKKNKVELKNVFYAFYKNNQLFIINKNKI